MVIEKYLGKTLEVLSQETHIFSKPVRVFFLSGPEDFVGKFFAQEFSVNQIVRKFPEAKHMVVKIAENYFGETILRIGAF